jgi:thiol-disulfide isomerase/thioredoxin
MISKIEISNYIYVLIMLLAFGCGTVMGQDFINGDFKDRIAKDVVAVEFWAGWNSANQFAELNKLKECESYRLDIMADADIQTEYNITAIPTIIIFDNGVEKVRFNANIMFQLEADRKTIQNSVDTIILNKFQ